MSIIAKTLRAAMLAAAAMTATDIIAGSDATARSVSISGTHSRSEIAGKCSAAGGLSSSGPNGYGCVNVDKGTGVNCDTKGHCNGWVPGVRGVNRAPVAGGLGHGTARALRH
jgi:hypothetical protein